MIPVLTIILKIWGTVGIDATGPKADFLQKLPPRIA
jgi:hypothetical protein